MPARLLELVKKKELDAFEARTLELLEAGELPVRELAACFRELEKAEAGNRVSTLTQMVFENLDTHQDAAGCLELSAAALRADPRNADARQLTIDLYRKMYGDQPGFEPILESSGLTSGAPPRTALRVLDFCLRLEPGETLISRMDDRVVEVADVDRERGLFTLRGAERMTTLPAREVVREYERISRDDFRALQQLYPERLSEAVERDPVSLVIGMIRAHGDLLNADKLKDELVPRVIDAKSWSKWWTRARAALKRNPHVILEGRAPVVMSYTAEGVSVEEETWATFTSKDDALHWLATAQGYIRDQRNHKQQPDAELLERMRDHIETYIERIRNRRPGEALACSLIIERLGEEGVPLRDHQAEQSKTLLSASAQPLDSILKLESDDLWEQALKILPEARPKDWADLAAQLFPRAPASQLDRLLAMLRRAERLGAAQRAIDNAVADPLDYPEVVYWIWREPEDAAGLQLPDAGELFGTILQTLNVLARMQTAPSEEGKRFRHRVKAAWSLKNYARVQEYLHSASPAAAIVLRRQLERLDGLGDNARTRMLDILRDAHPQLWVRHVVKLEPWEDPDIVWATQAGLNRKHAEREELVNVKMHENAVRIGEAASHGDLSENSEYKFALEERDFLRARLAQLQRELDLVRVLQPEEVPEDRIGVGTRAKLRDIGTGGERIMTFLGPFETDMDAGVYNYKAPVCQKLMGLRPGERATLTIDGVDHEFEVVRVENALAVHLA